jgi:carboxyl-terminal processing protease
MFLGTKFSKHFPSSPSSQAHASLDQLIQLIDREYADSVQTETLYQNGIEGIISQLDPHTVYIPKEELPRTNEELEGHFYGIGIQFFVYQDTVIISSVLTDGPAFGKGLFAGDKIIQIDDSLIAGQSLDDEAIIQRIRGKQNTQIKLLVIHPDGQKANVQLTRNTFPLHSVHAVMMPEPGTGYLAIRMFSENTHAEFCEALNTLKKSGLKRLIIDVRDNPGGYMTAVADIVDELVAGDHIVVKTKGKNAEEVLKTSKIGLFEQGELAILINENAASASEILAGSIQDLDRGIIIGRRSYGKGLVQEQFELPDESAIRITVARYYLPSGRCIQKPYQQGRNAYHEELMERFEKGEYIHADTEKTASKKQYFTLKKRVVYGDEGIRPDIFVGADTLRMRSKSPLLQSRIAERIAFYWLYQNKDQQKAYQNIEQFESAFQPGQAIVELAKNKLGIAIQPSLNQVFLLDFKSEIAGLLFGESGSAKINSPNDEFIQVAIKHWKTSK